MKKEEENPKEKYPWLDDKDERKYMADREILDKYINLENTCLTKAEKKEVRDLVYMYKDAFSLTLSTPHVTIVAISRLAKKVPLLELLHATKFSMRLVL